MVERCLLHGVFAAFAALGVTAVPVVYADERADAVRDQLLALDGVLAWVNRSSSPSSRGSPRA